LRALVSTHPLGYIFDDAGVDRGLDDLGCSGEELEVKIVRAEAFLCDVEVETVRTDAVQSFAKQETIFVDVETEVGLVGTGYSYTIGTGGRAVLDWCCERLLQVRRHEGSAQVERFR
jgi:hypothetical protein